MNVKSDYGRTLHAIQHHTFSRHAALNSGVMRHSGRSLLGQYWYYHDKCSRMLFFQRYQARSALSINEALCVAV